MRQTTDGRRLHAVAAAPGEYRVTVTLDGFQTFVREGVIVDALGVVGLNVTLQVGGITQEVTRVGRGRRRCATADARLGQTIRNDVYTALPLVMNTGGPRDPTAFMFLMPGVQSVGRWGNVMGGQDFTNDTYVEGVPITNAVVQGEGRNLSFGISVEAIDQFQVETSGTAVMYNGQGASNYVVKSGTNQFRGSGFEFFRNKALDAKAFFARHQAGRQPARIRLHARRADPQEPGCSSSSPTTATAIAGRRRRALIVDPDRWRSATAISARCRSPSTIRATTRPNPNGTGFVRDPFPGNIIPPGSHLADLAQLPVVPARSRPAPACRTTISAGRCRSASTTTTSRPRSICKLSTRQQVVGAVRARQAQPGDAVPRRHQRADRAAAALHGDAPGRGDSDDARR